MCLRCLLRCARSDRKYIRLTWWDLRAWLASSERGCGGDLRSGFDGPGDLVFGGEPWMERSKTIVRGRKRTMEEEMVG